MIVNVHKHEERLDFWRWSIDCIESSAVGGLEVKHSTRRRPPTGVLSVVDAQSFAAAQGMSLWSSPDFEATPVRAPNVLARKECGPLQHRSGGRPFLYRRVACALWRFRRCRVSRATFHIRRSVSRRVFSRARCVPMCCAGVPAEEEGAQGPRRTCVTRRALRQRSEQLV